MAMSFASAAGATRAASAILVFGLSLGGCANPPMRAGPSYVVLLPNEDGTVGKVQFTGRDGTTRLEEPREATVIDGAGGNRFTVDDETLAKEFGAAIAASPKAPISFLLYYESGGTRLTAESRALIPRVLDAVRQRPAADISVIGHTDTVGDALHNHALGSERARQVAELIRTEGKTQVIKMAIESHGERNLLVPTPDNLDEPRNRRVEVTVR